MLPNREIAKRKPTYTVRSFWWLELGREQCSACGHTYVYETGYYCVACDGGLCSVCVEETSADVFCAQCTTSERIETDARASDLEG